MKLFNLINLISVISIIIDVIINISKDNAVCRV